MQGQERANASRASGKRLPRARCEMVAVQKGASKETAFREGAHRDRHRQRGEGRAESGHPEETTRRTHKRKIPCDPETDHKLSIIINIKKLS